MKIIPLVFLSLVFTACRPSEGITVSARQVDLIMSPISDYDYPETTLVDRYPHDIIFKVLASEQIVAKVVGDSKFGARIRSAAMLNAHQLSPSSTDSELTKRLSALKEVTWADKEQSLIRIRFREVPPEIERKLCELHLVAFGRFYRNEK